MTPAHNVISEGDHVKCVVSPMFTTLLRRNFKKRHNLLSSFAISSLAQPLLSPAQDALSLALQQVQVRTNVSGVSVVSISMIRKSFLSLALVAASAAASAAPTTTAIGTFNILGTDYDVSLLGDTTFDAQSFNALSPTITFTNQADATAAVNVLFAALGPNYDWNPSCTICGTDQGFRVVYDTTATTYTYMTGYFLGAPNGPYTFGRDDANEFSFAQFSAHSTSVPEPNTGVLFALGLGLLAVAAIRRRDQTNS